MKTLVHYRLPKLLLITLTCLLCFYAKAWANSTISNEAQSPAVITDIQFLDTDASRHELSYAYSGDLSKPGLLFIHGTPGGWHAFEDYLAYRRLQKDFFMVSVDRYGWGKSAKNIDKEDSNFALQSLGIGSVFARYPNKKWILVGHSLGASIAPQIALDYPETVNGLLLLAGSLKPSLGAPRWYNYAASTWVVSRFLSKPMRYSNREIMALRKDLKKMDVQITESTLRCDVIIMHGKKDRLVSPKNPRYAMSAWADSFTSMKAVELENEGHFLPWRQSAEVVKLIYQLAAKQ